MGDDQGNSTTTANLGGADNVVSVDGLYRALASTRRRRLLYYLLDTEEASVGTLATVLAGWDAIDTGTLSTQADREQILLELEHIHLPLLADEGLLSYARTDGTVRIREVDESIRELIELTHRIDAEG
jgi:hypothetical protein